MQLLKAVVGHFWSWASSVLRRKDSNNKASGLVIFETVPSLQMRDFLFQFTLADLSWRHSGPAVESEGGGKRSKPI